MSIKKKKQPRFRGYDRIIQRVRIEHPDVADMRESVEVDEAEIRDLMEAEEMANQWHNERHPIEYASPLCSGGE